MKTSTMVYAALFCVAMLASYWTWTKEPEPVDDEGSIMLIDVKPEDVTKIAYQSKEVDATFEQKSDGLGKYLWVTTTRRVDKKAPQNPHDPHAGIDADTETTKTEGDTEVKTMAFKAGKAGDQLLEDLAPFKVSRKLDVKEADLADFGFDEPSGTLTVASKGGERKFEVGATAYGHKHVYLRDTTSKEVFVVKRSIVGPLERADTRLPEKELFEGPVDKLTAAHISTPGGSMQLVQRNRDDATKAAWTAPDSDAANTTADAWLDKVFRLRSSGYVAGELGKDAELVFAVKLEHEEAKPVKLEVLRGADEKGEELWFARSEYTRGLVKLNDSIAADAAADVATLFAGEAQ